MPTHCLRWVLYLFLWVGWFCCPTNHKWFYMTHWSYGTSFFFSKKQLYWSSNMSGEWQEGGFNQSMSTICCYLPRKESSHSTHSKEPFPLATTRLGNGGGDLAPLFWRTLKHVCPRDTRYQDVVLYWLFKMDGSCISFVQLPVMPMEIQ